MDVPRPIENYGTYPFVHSDTIRVEDDIVWMRFGNKEVVRFNFNIRDGAEYEYKLSDHSNYDVTVRKDLTVQTHGREFSNCIGFFFDIPGAADDEISYTFAKGVGIIQISGAWINIKLSSFALEN